jgi:hypothetical protein
MKYIVNYYDYDSDSYLEKDLYWMASYRGSFDFVPVSDGPKENWKGFTISGSGVNVFYNDKGLNITVDGFQEMKTGGYCKTTTFIKSVS